MLLHSFGFEANLVDNCVYQKFCGSLFVFLVLYVDDILLRSNHKGLLRETKIFLLKNFDMKDLREASFVLGITTKKTTFLFLFWRGHLRDDTVGVAVDT